MLPKSCVGVMEFSGIVEGKPIGSEWNKFKRQIFRHGRPRVHFFNKTIACDLEKLCWASPRRSFLFTFAIVCRKPKMTHWRTLEKSLSQVRAELTLHNHFLRKIEAS